MPRFISILIIGILATLAVTGCPKNSSDTTTVTEESAPQAETALNGGAANSTAAENGQSTAEGATPQDTASANSPASGKTVIDSLFTKRSAIQQEMETLRAGSDQSRSLLADAEQRMQNLEDELLTLAEQDRAGLMEQLETLALTDPALAAELTAIVSEPKSIKDLRGELKEIWEVEFTTTFGNFTVEVYPELAPVHAGRFLELVEDGFYDNMHIARIAPDWVVQWGEIRDLQATGLRPGQEPPPLDRYKDRAEMVVELKDEPVRFFTDQWTICFAKRGADTASTQPFINLKDNRQLETYTPPFSPFAYVTAGRENIERLVEAFGPAMESAKDDLRADYAAKGTPRHVIDQDVENDLAWGLYIDKYWDPFTMALITEARIIKRP